MAVRTCDSPPHQQGSALPNSLTASLERCRAISQPLSQAGLYQHTQPARSLPASAQATLPASAQATPAANSWRISPEPFWLTAQEASFFETLGAHLQAFYRAVNQLYHASRKGQQPAWVSGYCDQGKPDTIIDLGRMNRFKQQLPGVIRPDIIPAAASGWAITELDAVPGGIGLTAALARAYAEPGVGAGAIGQSPLPNGAPRYQIVGGPNGIVTGFAAMIRAAADQLRPQGGSSREPLLAIVVSEESRDYRAEMTWLAEALGRHGIQAVCLTPEEIRFTEQQLECDVNGHPRRIDVVYRFFELFDLKNIPKADLLLYAAKKGLVAMTPPPKTYLEEKLAFALLHHPALRPFWRTALSAETLAVLLAMIPPTWIVDPAPLPPHAIIPGLEIDGEAVTGWEQVSRASQKGRHLILKPSGFSPLAWGSRGVVVGHDRSQDAWAEAVQQAVGGFAQTPYVLQPFISGRPYTMAYWDQTVDKLVELQGRVRLSPYYFSSPHSFSSDAQVQLGGVLATFCPMDKKLLHGMSEAILAPCAVRGTAS